MARPNKIPDDWLIHYERGLNDEEIAEIYNSTRSAVWKKRKMLGLKSNNPERKPPEPGVPMEKALTPIECIRMREFLGLLVYYSGKCKHPNVSDFIRAYREVCI